MFVCERRDRGREGEHYWRILERGERDMRRVGTVQKQIRPAQHVRLHPPRLGWWHYSNHSPNQYFRQHIGDQSKCQDRIDHAQSNVT